MYSKQLVESKDDIAEYKRKFNILNHQIVQLKEEIAVKEQVRCVALRCVAMWCGARSSAADVYCADFSVVVGGARE